MLIQPASLASAAPAQSILLSSNSFFSDILKSLFDAIPPLIVTYLARRYCLIITPALSAFTISFFAMRVLLHTLNRLDRNLGSEYAHRYTVLLFTCRNQLNMVRSRFPRIEPIIYLACFLFTYLYMPVGLTLSVLCGISRGLLLPI